MNQQEAIKALNKQVAYFYNEKLFKQSNCVDMQLLANDEMMNINNILKMGVSDDADMDYLIEYQYDCLLALLTDIIDYYESELLEA
jgi:hypothetical protein